MKIGVLSEKTLLPISFLSVLAIIIYIFARVQFQTEANAEQIEVVKKEQEKYNENHSLILQRIADINGQLKRMRGR